MLCDIEIEGSCQHIDGLANYNKCLLAYVADGKNRLVAIKELSTGQIKARAILRLLIEKETGQPVLFIERTYPNLIREQDKALLLALAKQKADYLGLSLYNSIEKEGQGGPIEIISLGSPAPYEYVDATTGIQLKGEFTISRAYRV